MSSLAAVAADGPGSRPGAGPGEGPTARARRTLVVGTRLALAANTTLNFSMLFALLYLRLNDFNGGFKPAGVDAPGLGVGLLTIGLQLISLVAVGAALGGLRRGVGAARVLVAVGLLFGIASAVVRVYQEYHLGTGSELHKSTYSATAALWFGILVVEVVLGCLWMIFILGNGRERGTHEAQPSVAGELAAEPAEAVTHRHLRAFGEYWLYLTVLSTGVFILIHLI